MSDRKLIVLGTASQVPGRTRNQNGYLLRFDDEGFLFDPGEGTQRQMIVSGVSVSEITKIFITHFHGDHCLGLAGIIQRISLDRVPHEVEVYYPASGRKFYEHLRDSSLYYNTARLKECPVEKAGLIYSDKKISIEAMPLDHVVETYGYRIRENDSFTLIPEELDKAGIRGNDVGELKSKGSVTVDGRTVHIEDVGKALQGQVFAFVMDTRECKAAYDLAQGADLCVMEATYLSDKEDLALEYCHLTSAQAGRIARDAHVKRLVLSHYSQRYESTELFLSEALEYHDDVIVAQDGDYIFMPKRKRDLV
jgi:ribonuclease Z